MLRSVKNAGRHSRYRALTAVSYSVRAPIARKTLDSRAPRRFGNEELAYLNNGIKSAGATPFTFHTLLSALTALDIEHHAVETLSVRLQRRHDGVSDRLILVAPKARRHQHDARPADLLFKSSGQDQPTETQD